MNNSYENYRNSGYNRRSRNFNSSFEQNNQTSPSEDKGFIPLESSSPMNRRFGGYQKNQRYSNSPEGFYNSRKSFNQQSANTPYKFHNRNDKWNRTPGSSPNNSFNFQNRSNQSKVNTFRQDRHYVNVFIINYLTLKITCTFCLIFDFKTNENKHIT